jgi:hypothetical protein
MSYMEDSIDWQDLEQFDIYLDAEVGDQYQDQPLAQDWARISKVGEELGEAIQKFIGITGQNPRKGYQGDMAGVLDELADTAFTAIYAIQHFTKSSSQTRFILRAHQAKARRYMEQYKARDNEAS